MDGKKRGGIAILPTRGWANTQLIMIIFCHRYLTPEDVTPKKGIRLRQIQLGFECARWTLDRKKRGGIYIFPKKGVRLWKGFREHRA